MSAPQSPTVLPLTCTENCEASAGCSACHTLKAAGATGTLGPNLDQLKPPYDRVLHQVEVGGGPMPAFKNTLSAKQIQDVAAFVVASTHA